MQVMQAPEGRRGRHDPTVPGVWLLDVDRFHATFGELFAHLDGPLGAEPLRTAAATVWCSDDPVLRTYLREVPTETPDDWAEGFDETHLAQWYRLLLGPHLVPVPEWPDPVALGACLDHLGWSTAEARRLTQGRELVTLAEQHPDPACAAALGLTVPVALRGWMSSDDVASLLDRLATTPRRRFRGAPQLVPLCERVWSGLQRASVAERALLFVPPT